MLGCAVRARTPSVHRVKPGYSRSRPGSRGASASPTSAGSGRFPKSTAWFASLLSSAASSSRARNVHKVRLVRSAFSAVPRMTGAALLAGRARSQARVGRVYGGCWKSFVDPASRSLSGTPTTRRQYLDAMWRTRAWSARARRDLVGAALSSDIPCVLTPTRLTLWPTTKLSPRASGAAAHAAHPAPRRAPAASLRPPSAGRSHRRGARLRMRYTQRPS